MTRFGKVWGSTRDILKTPLCHIAQIEIEPFSVCSWHKHERKHNLFYVLQGELIIEVKKIAYRLTDTTILRPYEATTVAPGEVHRFRTGDLDCMALEIYFLEPLDADIIRQGVGRKL